jgi:lipoate-protein ligase A
LSAAGLAVTGRPREVELRVDLAPADPAAVVAESRALLAATAGAEQGRAVVRLFRVRDCVAFGPQDERAPAYARALAAARGAGYAAVPRVEGGRAIAAGPGVLGIAWTVADREARARIRPRFSLLAGVIAEALRTLGVDAEVGPVAGEYCPGDFSVGAGGRVKLAGLGQRVTASGAHLGAFVVIEDAARLRAVLGAVYGALGIAWQPASLGCVRDLRGESGIEDVASALVAALGRHVELRPAAVASGTAGNTAGSAG